jgi:leader peptidase (prepilin peptidase)/N-methyltransferase
MGGFVTPTDSTTLIFLCLIAPVIGSFLGVVIMRLPTGEPILIGRSKCPACGARLAPWEMIPLVSFLVQKAHCRHCGTAIAPLHFWVELAALAVALMAAWRAQSVPELVAWCVLGFILLTLAWLDARDYWLPDVITLPGILAGFAMCAWIAPAGLAGATLADHAAGAAIGFLALALLRVIYRYLRGRDGIGLGDAKLLALAGAWTGWEELASIMLGAAMLGIAIALLGHLRGNPASGRTRLPLGALMAPFIFLAALGLLP